MSDHPHEAETAGDELNPKALAAGRKRLERMMHQRGYLGRGRVAIYGIGAQPILSAGEVAAEIIKAYRAADPELLAWRAAAQREPGLIEQIDSVAKGRPPSRFPSEPGTQAMTAGKTAVSNAPTIEIKLKPWDPPNFARLEQPPERREDGPKELPAIAVADLTQKTLDGMARQWLEALYAKAGKPNPYSVQP